MEQHNRRLLQTRGELSQERIQLGENLATGLSKLLANAQQMAELLDEPLPELPQDSKWSIIDIRCDWIEVGERLNWSLSRTRSAWI